MDSVKVSKLELERIVQINRDKHGAEYAEAFSGYRMACISALEANLEAFRAGKAERIFINEHPPEDHTKDYERVLRMLAMSTEAEVTLSAESFEHYVLDDWQWRRVWSATNAKYLSK